MFYRSASSHGEPVAYVLKRIVFIFFFLFIILFILHFSSPSLPSWLFPPPPSHSSEREKSPIGCQQVEVESIPSFYNKAEHSIPP